MIRSLVAPTAALLLAACSQPDLPPRHAGSPPFESRVGAPSPAPAPDTGAAEAERRLCSELAAEALLDVELVTGGVALIARPRPGQRLDGALAAMKDIHEAMTPDGNLTAVAGAPVAAPLSPDRCALFDAARAGARADIDALPDEVRIVITSADPAAIEGIRDGAARFVAAARAATPR